VRGRDERERFDMMLVGERGVGLPFTARAPGAERRRKAPVPGARRWRRCSPHASRLDDFFADPRTRSRTASAPAQHKMSAPPCPPRRRPHYPLARLRAQTGATLLDAAGFDAGEPARRGDGRVAEEPERFKEASTPQ
jgi:hypothetical protein